MTEANGSEPNGIVLSAAYGVALRARMGGLQGHEVDAMRVQAEELLPRTSQLRVAILTFATMFEADRRNDAAVREHGEELQRNINRAMAPASPDRERRDIHD